MHVPWLSSVLWAKLMECMTDAGFSDRAVAIFCGKSLNDRKKVSRNGTAIQSSALWDRDEILRQRCGRGIRLGMA